MMAAPENSPFVNATFRSIGTIHSVKGKSEGNGAIALTCANGDKVFGLVKFGGIHMQGPTNGVVEFIGGTGKCTGIEDRMELMARPKTMSSKDGTYQHIAVGYITWKIP